MAGGEEERIDAARILLSLRHRKLLRWPEWVPRPSSSAELRRREKEEPVVEEEENLPVPLSKGLRGRRRRTDVWPSASQLPYRGTAGSGASPSQEDAARSTVAGRSDTPPSGSRHSTSGADPAPTEKAEVKGGAGKETMAVLSPNTTLNTPVEYPSSGDDGTRSPPDKRKAPEAGGSVVVLTGDKGCGSPAKRPRADLNVDEPNVEKKKKTQEEENCRDEKGHLLLDLNEMPSPWED